MFTLFFTDKDVKDYKSAMTCDTKRYAKFFNAMLKAGVYLPPSQFEACFLSVAHSRRDIEATVKAARLAKL
jgi:glutamate-1-semialdehyde 2,1-aminomutase